MKGSTPARSVVMHGRSSPAERALTGPGETFG